MTYKDYKEHVRQAEELLEIAEKADPGEAALLVGRAQVHATLAQVLLAERTDLPPQRPRVNTPPPRTPRPTRGDDRTA